MTELRRVEDTTLTLDGFRFERVHHTTTNCILRPVGPAGLAHLDVLVANEGVLNHELVDPALMRLLVAIV